MGLGSPHIDHDKNIVSNFIPTKFVEILRITRLKKSMRKNKNIDHQVKLYHTV